MITNLGQFTREQIQEIVPSSLAILPVGAIEQHGYHLPLYTDYFIVKHISHLVSQKMQGEVSSLVCPPIPYGNSHHHFPYPALSLTSETLIMVLKDLVASLALMGFKHVFILNAHGGNDEAIRIVTRDAAREHQIAVASASYWTLALDRLSALFKEMNLEIGQVPGHAGGFETSLMLAIDEAYVHLQQRPPFRQDPVVTKAMKNRVFIQRPGNSVGQDGFSDDARNASKSIGEQSLAIIIEEAANTISQFYKG
ncbi:MAG: creatininase family protein [Desulfitobacteriaceae bacterium]